ncbi:hypothetical protein C8R45DRAFT_778039, partial [Mycena sanguinolenta]
EQSCSCGSGLSRTTKCFDCSNYPAACSSCFVRDHIHNPLHWAEVWDPLHRFFVRQDISKLGHSDHICGSPTPTRTFTIGDRNGGHSTKLAFCGCQEQPPNKLRQLMRFGLFPGTTRDPHTAFTINMLKDFQLHNFESKKAAYDYLGAIQRLTDNSFTADVPNPYAAFLRIVRVFNFLMLKKRSGQYHGIDRVLPHRPAGNLLVWCPACPEPEFNSDPNRSKTPSHLLHINQSQRTLDRNHQCNQFSKNTDPDDISLCTGKGYFPLDAEYQEYLQSKLTCNYLKVVKKQDKKKFKNMAITGTVNCQCSHVFILSTVDLPHAERFAKADYALAMAIWNHMPGQEFAFKLRIEMDDVDEVSTYDIACEYVAKLAGRFEKYFPDQLEAIKKMRWGVPALHVQGHQDSCTYLFGTAYMECIGHFHGETAEHYWPEANQLGPHVRQMNLGHRQDTIINHHGDWNHKKTMHISSDLVEDIMDAKRKYIEKRNHFIALSISFKDLVPTWKKKSRTPNKVGKEAVSVSVYKHSTTKVPSQKSNYKAMLAKDDHFESTMIPKTELLASWSVAQYVLFTAFDRTKLLKFRRRKLRYLIKNTAEHELQSRKEISIRTAKLTEQIASFRQDQRDLMPEVGDKVVTQTATMPAIEDEHLYLPSDFSPAERQRLKIERLGLEEAKWREG